MALFSYISFDYFFIALIFYCCYKISIRPEFTSPNFFFTYGHFTNTSIAAEFLLFVLFYLACTSGLITLKIVNGPCPPLFAKSISYIFWIFPDISLLL